MTRIRERLAREEGFTLIELLVVIVIIGILLAIAVPSYLGFRDRAADSAASANVRAAVPSAEAYFADNGTYATMVMSAPLPSTTGLKENYDSGLKVTGSHPVTINAKSANAYCLQAVGHDASTKFYFSGPGGEVTSTKPAGCA
jgi:type IV pilus assembly protein PilA